MTIDLCMAYNYPHFDYLDLDSRSQWFDKGKHSALHYNLHNVFIQTFFVLFYRGCSSAGRTSEFKCENPVLRYPGGTRWGTGGFLCPVVWKHENIAHKGRRQRRWVEPSYICSLSPGKAARLEFSVHCIGTRKLPNYILDTTRTEQRMRGMLRVGESGDSCYRAEPAWCVTCRGVRRQLLQSRECVVCYV